MSFIRGFKKIAQIPMQPNPFAGQGQGAKQIPTFKAPTGPPGAPRDVSVSGKGFGKL